MRTLKWEPIHATHNDKIRKLGNMMGDSAQNWAAGKWLRTKMNSTMHYFQYPPFCQIPLARWSHTAGFHLISNQVGTWTVASSIHPTCFFGSKLLNLGWCLHRVVLVHLGFPRVFNSTPLTCILQVQLKCSSIATILFSIAKPWDEKSWWTKSVLWQDRCLWYILHTPNLMAEVIIVTID